MGQFASVACDGQHQGRQGNKGDHATVSYAADQRGNAGRKCLNRDLPYLPIAAGKFRATQKVRRED